MAKIKKISILLLLILSSIYIFGQPKFGLPEIINYSNPSQAFSNTQVWQIYQKPDGLMYFAADKYFLEYDGTNWRVLKYFIDDNIQSFVYDPDSDIFYLGLKYNIAKATLTENKFNVIPIGLNANVLNIWTTYKQDSSIYFFANKKDIIYLNNNVVEKLNRSSAFEVLRGFQSDGKIFAVSRFGIAEVKGKNLQIISSKYQNIYSEDIRILVDYDSNNYLLGTLQGNLYLMSKTSDKIVNFKVNSDVFKGAFLYKGYRYNDSTFIISTLSAGIFIINKNGQILLHLDQKNGLTSDAVYYVYVDMQKNLWLGTGRGVSYVKLNSPVYSFDDRNNLKDIISNIYLFQNKLFVATYEDISYTDLIQDNYCFKLKKIKNSGRYGDIFKKINIYGNKYLINRQYGQIQIFDTAGVILKTWKIGQTLDFAPYPPDNRYIFISSNITVSLYKIEKDLTLTKIREFPEMNFLIKKFFFDRYNDLWMIMDNILFCFDFKENNNFNDYKEYVFDSHSGLPQGKFLDFFTYPEKFVLMTDSGLYCTENKTVKLPDMKFQKADDSISKYLNNTLIFAETKDSNNIYFLTNDFILKYRKKTGHIEKYNFSKYYDFNSVNIFSYQGNLLLNDNQKVYCVDTNFQKTQSSKENFVIKLRSYGFSDGKMFFIYKSDKNIKINDSLYQFNMNFSSKDNIEFLFYSNALMSDLKYYYRFVEESENYQFFSSNTLIFRHLKPGKHLIEIIAKDENGHSSKEIYIQLKVKRNRYFSIAAIIAYILLFSVFVWIIVRFRLKSIKRQKNALKAALLQREKMLEQKQEEIKLQADNLKKQKQLLDRERNKLQVATIELQQLSLVAQKTSNSVVIIDKKGKFEWVNRGYADLFSTKIEKYKDLPLKEAHRRIRPDIYKEIAFFTPDKGTISYTNHEVFDNGEEIWYQTTIYPIIDDKGDISKFVVIDINITDLKLYERKFQNQNEINKLIKEELNSRKAKLKLVTEDLAQLAKDMQISIDYAKFLRTSLITTQSELDNIFSMNFVLDLPMQKISGDFYFTVQNNDEIFVVFGDASGHNVHGAVMAAISVSIAKDVYFANQNLSPEKLLNIFNDKLYDFLRQCKKEKEMIQMILMKINKKNKKIDFASSKIPLTLVRNKIKFIKLSSNRIDLGIKKSYAFNSYSFDYQDNDTIYLITDGWPYQFGKFGQKKYSSKGIEKFLLKIQDKDFDKHKELIFKEIQNWRGNQGQTDDILVLGFKLIDN